jgi:Endoglucanase Y
MVAVRNAEYLIGFSPFLYRPKTDRDSLIRRGKAMKNGWNYGFTLGLLLVLCLGPALSSSRAESTASTGAAAINGNYRNLFKEIGKSDADISGKINTAWNQLFYGDNNLERVYYEAGPDMAYVKDIGNDDIRTEGMSYAMMICVQMDKKAEFDKIWKWAKTNMYYTSGQYKGYFAWHCKEDGTKIDGNPTPAPDGEEYFATALIFAAKRWGNGSGIFDYATEAQNLLKEMLHHGDNGVYDNMFDLTHNEVVFCPTGSAVEFSDPSYHLPAFYEVWAGFTNSRADRERWLKITDTSRKFFANAANPVTGLCPDYANWDGSPRIQEDPHQYFQYDAWRVISNAAVDYAWWGKDNFEPVFADRLQAFFDKQGITAYGNLWTLDGKVQNNDHSTGLVAMNAVASLAATHKTLRDKYVEELWKLSTPTGKWRYYDGLLYMMALLHCSGNFKAYF